jgi:hypothetical protein
MSASASLPSSRRLVASRFWRWVNFGFRPSLTPRALARSRPSAVRRADQVALELGKPT